MHWTRTGLELLQLRHTVRLGYIGSARSGVVLLREPPKRKTVPVADATWPRHGSVRRRWPLVAATKHCGQRRGRERRLCSRRRTRRLIRTRTTTRRVQLTATAGLGLLRAVLSFDLCQTPRAGALSARGR